MTESPTTTKTKDFKIIATLENENHLNSSKEVLSRERDTAKRSLPYDETTISRVTEAVENFDDMNLREVLLRGIYGYGIERPSYIQQRALRPCIEGYNMIIQAPSGMSKTITFIISILQKLDMDCKDCQAIILVPTRELAQGIRSIVLTLGKHMNIECLACIGGVNVCENTKQLEAGAQIVVGTPVRTYDILKRSILRSGQVKILVLAEADELLSRGFKDQIYDMFPMLPENVQVIILSATMSYDISEITPKLMDDPVQILMKREEKTLEGIRQFYVNVEREDWKLDTLYTLLDTLAITQLVIYCNTCQKIDWLAEKLNARNSMVSSLHHNMDAKQLNDAVKGFRTGSSRILVREDMPSVGTDVPQVSLFINYDLPTNHENYVHRIGRSGAFGRKGLAINFITADEQETLNHLEHYYNTQINELPMNIADLI